MKSSSTLLSKYLKWVIDEETGKQTKKNETVHLRSKDITIDADFFSENILVN